MISFKIVVRSIIGLALLILVMTGCSNNDDQKIKVFTHSGDGQFVEFKEIEDQEKVAKVRKLLRNADWEKGKVVRERGADYQFAFAYINGRVEAKSPLYSVWISPNDDLLEIVQDDHKYIQLNHEDSKTLFEILTGTTLDKK